MGLPVHVLGVEYQDTWIETLRRELAEYATVEAVSDPGEETQTVYVVGNCGHFVLMQEPYHQKGILLLMFPFLCSENHYDPGMRNLEERIHRVLDTMSVALKPEEIERYEKSRWTRFFRLFGWEHVGSLDFAHRRKKVIIEGDFDSDPPVTNKRRSDCYIHCKSEYQSTWSELVMKRLNGMAKVSQIQGPMRAIFSPNGRYRVETPTYLRVESPQRRFYGLNGEFDGSKYWLSWPFTETDEPEHAYIGSDILEASILKIYQEIATDDLHENAVMTFKKLPSRFYGRTGVLNWILCFFFVYLALFAMLFWLEIIQSANGKPDYEAGIPLTIMSPFLMSMAILMVSPLLVRQWPVIHAFKEGIQIRYFETYHETELKGNVLTTIYSSLWHAITLQKFRMKTIRLRWNEICHIWSKTNSCVILAVDANGDPVAFSYGQRAFGISAETVGETLCRFRYDHDLRRSLQGW